MGVVRRFSRAVAEKLQTGRMRNANILLYILVGFFVSISCCLSQSNFAYAATSDEFVTTWKTDNGDPGDYTIEIPTNSAYTYNYDVDWNDDGVFDELGVTGNVTHDYGVAGTFNVAIRGTFPAIQFNYGSVSRPKLIDVAQWGTIAWKDFNNAFIATNNLKVTATDAPDLSDVTDLSHMFEETYSLTGDFSSWDTSNITNMSSMFASSGYNGDLSSWDTSNVTSISAMFYNNGSFNGDIASWDTSNVTNMSAVFASASNFNQDISSWDTSHVTTMSSMFYGTPKFNQSLASWDTDNVTDMSYMFSNAQEFNSNISNWFTSSVTDMSGMFSGALKFNRSLAAWDTSNVTSMYSMFENTPVFNQSLAAFNMQNVEQANNMLDNSKLSLANYDATLSAWSSQALQNNVHFDARNLLYCNAHDDRQNIISNFNWTISGDRYTCDNSPPDDVSSSGPRLSIVGVTTPIENSPIAPKRITFRGYTLPGATTTVYINNILTSCVGQRLGSDPAWECMLPIDLEPGKEYTVTATIKYADSTTRELGPYQITIEGAAIPTSPSDPDDDSSPTVTNEDKNEKDQMPLRAPNTGTFAADDNLRVLLGALILIVWNGFLIWFVCTKVFSRRS